MDIYWITWFPGSVLACLGILALVYKGILALTKVTDAANVTRVIQADVSELKLEVANIKHEFHPNSGTSMRDQVDAISTTQQLDKGVMQSHMDNDKSAFARQDRVNNRIESVLDRLEDHLRNK